MAGAAAACFKLEGGTVVSAQASFAALNWPISPSKEAGRMDGAETRSMAAFTLVRSPAAAIELLRNASPPSFFGSSKMVMPP